MNKQSDGQLLNSYYIAAPCPMKWESLEGDDRVRFCSKCELNVYNVENLSTNEAADLIRNTESRLCLRLYRKLDGTVITKNCPVGVKYLHRFARAAIASILALIVWFGFIDSANAQGLVGAPVDPRYGQSGMSESPSVAPDAMSVALLLPTLMVFSPIWSVLFRKKATLLAMALFVAIILFISGYFLGLVG